VGPKGTVYAVDTRSDYLAFVKDRAGKKGLANVTAVPVGKEGPDLPPAAFDLVFMRNVFHHLSEPEEYARALKKCLRAGGKLVIVEHKPKGGVSHVALFKHHTSPEAIVETLDKAGLTMVDSLDLLPKQSFLVFSPKKTVAGDPIDG
jgi:SAM-dependent methyltransferase